MKMYKHLALGILIGTTVFSSRSFAQGGEGVGTHGGNAVVCFSDPKIAETLTIPGRMVATTIPDRYLNKITLIETLDLWDAKMGPTRGDRTLIEMKPGETPDEYALRIAERFSGWSNEITSILGEYPTSYFNTQTYGSIIKDGKKAIIEVDHLKDPSLAPAEDIDPMIQAKTGCVYATIAKQGRYGYSNTRKLVIDDRLFYHKAHSELSKAVLLVHEYVLASMGAEDGKTEIVRTLVANMITKDLRLVAFANVISSNPFYITRPFTPIAIYDLMSEYSNLQKNYALALSNSRYKAEKEFTTNHLSEVPQKIVKEYWTHTYNDFVTNIYSCDKLRKQQGRNKISQEDCAALDRLGAQRESEINTAIQKTSQNYIQAYQVRWKLNKMLQLEALSKIILSPIQRSRMEIAIEALNPFVSTSSVDLEPFKVDPSSVIFPN